MPSLDVQQRVVNKYLAKKDEIIIIKNKLKQLEESLSDIANDEF